ncbi:MAG: SPFH domain-containing protein [Polyangiaceae bacterium]|nr:SPFH domain-containing protein [Polyangiaceae bacterium]
MVARSQSDLIAERTEASARVGEPLVVTAGDAAVLVFEGQALITLGPGAHTLDPGAIPGLGHAVDPSGEVHADIWFVRTDPVGGVRVGGALGHFAEPARNAVVAASWSGALSFHIADPVRWVLCAPPGPAADHQLRERVQSALLRTLQANTSAFAQHAGAIAPLGDPARLAEVTRAAHENANRELAQLGLQIVQIEQSQIAFSESASAAAAPSAPTEQAYEMLWDCPHCGTKKNLGLSHRHCPNCGGPQDAQWRYFPADHEKVAVQDHVYAGADLECRYCGAFNGRRCRHCASCGAPLEGATQARMRQDQLTQGEYSGETREHARREWGHPPAAAQQAPSKRRAWPWILAAAVVLALVVGVFLVKQNAELTVAGHGWKREVAVERFGPVQDSDWCDAMPRRATNVHRSRQVRSHKEVPDGQDCKTRRQDRGDGTYVEKRQCTTRYRKEPVYDDKCSYTIVKWAPVRTEKLTGSSAKDAPRWPAVQLARPGECVGCEREGARTEEYVVQFVRRGDGEKASCRFDQRRWASLEVGTSLRGKFSVIGSVLDCDTLTAL